MRSRRNKKSFVKLMLVSLLLVIVVIAFKFTVIEAKESNTEYQSVLIGENENLDTIISKYCDKEQKPSQLKKEIIKINGLKKKGHFITAGDYIIVPIYK